MMTPLRILFYYYIRILGQVENNKQKEESVLEVRFTAHRQERPCWLICPNPKEICEASDIFQRTPNTVVKYDQLLMVLGKVRENGYALDEEENEPGIRCIGAPIFNHKGDVIGAISISGPTMRVTPEEVKTFRVHILKYTRLISQELGYSL